MQTPVESGIHGHGVQIHYSFSSDNLKGNRCTYCTSKSLRFTSHNGLT